MDLVAQIANMSSMTISISMYDGKEEKQHFSI